MCGSVCYNELKSARRAERVGFMVLERVTPESVGIRSEGVLQFLELIEQRGVELHSMMLLRHGKVCAEGWWKPYNPASPHMMFSFTKALTSTAIGFAWQEGKVKLEDKLCEIFPDKMPAEPSENLLNCTVRDLLTMSCGHANEISAWGVDWVEKFLAHEFTYKPSEAFMYNTAGTNMLCAVLKRRTGMDLFEYLTPRLFEPLGISDIECFTLADGTEMGGAGSRLKAEDMARFIQFAAWHGQWEGKQLLDAKWFEMASSKQIETVSPVYDSANPDWRCGYGFQFWRCVPEKVFRADGAFGQYGVVFEDKDAVLILQSASANQQVQLTCAWEALLPAMTDEETLPASTAAHVLKHRLEKAEIVPMLSMRNAGAENKYSGKIYTPAEKMQGLADFIGGIWIVMPQGGETKRVHLDFEADRAWLVFEQDNGDFKAEIGLNSHFTSFTLCGRTYGAVGRWRSDNRFELEIRCAEAVGGRRMIFNFSAEQLVIESESTLPISGGIADKPYAKYTLNAE